MVTLAVVVPELAEGLEDPEDVESFLSDEHPDNPATKIAAPATPTSNACFTPCSFVSCDPSTVTDRREKYGGLLAG